MDIKLQSLLRTYQQNKDAASAIAFAEAFSRSIVDPLETSQRFYDAWWWLFNHPAFHYRNRMAGEPGFLQALDIYVARVDPNTRRIEDDKSRNTQPEVWLEIGPWVEPSAQDFMLGDWDTGVPSHDYNLDCGAQTFEEAILKLADLVKEHYGDYTSDEENNG